MKNRLTIYAKLLKDNLTGKGCDFIMQRAEPVSNSIVMQFRHNNISQSIIGKCLDPLKCIYRMEYGKDIVTLLLQIQGE